MLKKGKIMEKCDEDKIKECVDDTLQGWFEGRFSLNELRTFHRQVSLLSRQASRDRHFQGDRNAAIFMHQVTHGALVRLKTKNKRIGVRNMRSQRDV